MSRPVNCSGGTETTSGRPTARTACNVPLIGKFDGSGVSGSTGRGRSQALESKVRFADHPGGDALQFLGSPVYLR